MFELFNLSKNVVKNIVKDLRKDDFIIKYLDKELDDYHKNSISFFSNSISIGNLDILWKQTLLNHEIYILQERNKTETSKLEKLFSKKSNFIRPSIDNTLMKLERENSEANSLLRSKLDSNITNFLDDTLKNNLPEEYVDDSCFCLLKKLYKEVTDEKFILEGEQDSYFCFITINEYEIKKEFFSCVDYYDYQPGDEFDHDAYMRSYTE